jgi:GTPase SAR1 family protein
LLDLKIIVLGPAAVGKTSLIVRYAEGRFGETVSVSGGLNRDLDHHKFLTTTQTVGASFVLKIWGGLKLGIWVGKLSLAERAFRGANYD